MLPKSTNTTWRGRGFAWTFQNLWVESYLSSRVWNVLWWAAEAHVLWKRLGTNIMHSDVRQFDHFSPCLQCALKIWRVKRNAVRHAHEFPSMGNYKKLTFESSGAGHNFTNQGFVPLSPSFFGLGLPLTPTLFLRNFYFGFLFRGCSFLGSELLQSRPGTART